MDITCPQCGFSRSVAKDKLPEGSVIAKCPKCHCRFRFSAKEGPGAILPPKEWNRDVTRPPEEEDIRETAKNAYEAEQRRFEASAGYAKARADLAAAKATSRNPWDTAPEPEGWLAAFYQTLVNVMFHAQGFFSRLAPDAGMGRPLAFFLIISVFQSLVERVWGQMMLSYLEQSTSDDPAIESLITMFSPETNILVLVAFRCLSQLLQLYLFSLLMFLVYKLLAGNRATFILIFQIMAYSAAPWILCVIPGLGSIGGSIWGLACAAIGLKSALRLSWAQTVAGFLPVIALVFPLLTRVLDMLS